MAMTLAQIDARLKEAEQHNTQLATRKAMYAERLQKEFGVSSAGELKAMLAQAEEQLKQKEAAYEVALAEAERLLNVATSPSSNQVEFNGMLASTCKRTATKLAKQGV